MTSKLLRWSAATVTVVAMLGGCSGGGSGGSGGSDGGSAAHAGTSTSPSGRPAQPASSISEQSLQDALLTEFQDLSPITAAQTGSYDSLPAADVASGAQRTPAGADVKPSTCKTALWAGPDVAQYAKATATVVAYRKAGDTSPGGVQAWEELVASGSRSPQTALGSGPVKGCDSVKVSYKGNDLAFAEQKPPVLGSGSRGALLTPSSPKSRPTWVVTFVGNGYTGVILMQGSVSKSKVDAFASAAYKTAHDKLG